MSWPAAPDVGLRPFTVSRVIHGELVLLSILAVNGPTARRLADDAKAHAETSGTAA